MWKNLTLERAGSKKSSIFGTGNEGKTMVSYIIISSLLVCAGLFCIEQIVEVNYAIKTGVKLLVFLLIPLIYFLMTRDKNVYIVSPSKFRSKRALFIGLFLGIIFFIVLMAAYYILQAYIDFRPIITELETKLKITSLNFLLIGLYITLGNSFIEEFFFRGFVFLGLYRADKPKSAYIYSSMLFALYHIMIFRSWFTLPIFLLAILGLFIVGLLFNWMDTKSNSFVNSWIAHILADAAIILIGLKMFGIISF